MLKTKIFEVGAEGGSLAIYKAHVSNRDIYFTNENYEITQLIATDKENEYYSFSFAKELNKAMTKYHNLLSLYPLYVDLKYRNQVLKFLKDYQLEKENTIDVESWSVVLNENVDNFKIENPTYTKDEYFNLKKKYGNYASWALWNENDEKDTNIIEENIGMLNSRFVGIALNISKPVSNWSNFRGGTHDRKLKLAFNKGRIKGFYLTDLLKNVVEVNSTTIEKKIKNQEIQLDPHISFFIEEMKDIKVTDETEFLIFGNQAYKLFDNHLKRSFPNNKITHLRHYSARGTDKEWITKTLDKIGFLEEFFNNGIINIE